MISSLTWVRAAARTSSIALAAGLLAPMVQSAAAQQHSSAETFLSGHVYDADGSALPGARVTVAETGVEATTSFDGSFTIAVPANRAATLQFDYLGRPNESRTIEVAEHRTPVEMSMGHDNAILVTGTLTDTVARALNQQRQADNTATVLSSDAIGRFPDPNIAEALQRAPGIAIERDQGEGRYVNVRGAPSEFSAVTVDGVSIPSMDPLTRAVNLDTLPSDIVSNIEVSKSLLPYQDADSVSGAINVRTRSAFDRRSFAMSGMAGAGYNQFGNTNDYRASGTVSTVTANRTIGVLVSGSYSQTNRRPENVENVWGLIGPDNAKVYGLTETLFKDYRTKRERIAGTAALEWRPTDGARMWVRGSYAQFEDDEYRDQLGIIWSDGTLQPGATDSTATFTNTRITKQVRHRIQRNVVWSITGGGEYQIGGGKLYVDAAYSKSDQTYPRRDELLYRLSTRPTVSYAFPGSGKLPTYSLFTTNEHLNASAFNFYENAFRWNTTLNDEKSFSARFDAPLPVGGRDITISLGGKYRERNIFADEERLRDRRASSAPTQPLSYFLSGNDSRNFDYLLGKTVDGDKADAHYDLSKPNAPRRMPQSVSADYTASEKILGMFGQARGEFGGTTVIAGLRVETTNFKAETPTGLAPATQAYTDFFPNLTLRQAFTPNLIGRFALWRGINRPNFPAIVPRVLDSTDGATVRIELGNPALQPLVSNNIDLGLEYYLRPLGMLSASVFYKDLNDFRYTVTRMGTYLGAPALLTRPENAPSGKLYGIELNWQQQFTFLPGVLSDLGVFANYTYTQGEASLGQAYAGRSVFPLPGQSKHLWNAALFYERGPVTLRVSYTKRSDYLNEINADVPALDLYWKGRGQLDATANFEVLDGINLFFEAKNLTNSPGVRYYGTIDRVYEYEKFGYSLFGGVRVKI
ncbi:MAG: TonB-dependent receptor [Altererythrobacter sp.]|nr:TonB-dependent receptor [Altererythrobacter sp.]